MGEVEAMKLTGVACTRAALAAVLRVRLAEAGLTRRELAARAGIGLRTLHTYLSGVADAPLSAVVALAAGLGTTFTGLASDVDALLGPGESAGTLGDDCTVSSAADSGG